MLAALYQSPLDSSFLALLSEAGFEVETFDQYEQLAAATHERMYEIAFIDDGVRVPRHGLAFHGIGLIVCVGAAFDGGKLRSRRAADWINSQSAPAEIAQRLSVLRARVEIAQKHREVREVKIRPETLPDKVTPFEIINMSCILDAGGVIQYVSKTFLRQMRVELTENFIGRTFLDFIVDEYQDGFKETMHNALRPKVTSPINICLRRSDGCIFPLEADCHKLLGYNNAIEGVQVYLRENRNHYSLEFALKKRIDLQMLVSSITADLFSGFPGRQSLNLRGCLKEICLFSGADHCVVEYDLGRLKRNPLESDWVSAYWTHHSCAKMYEQLRQNLSAKLPWMNDLAEQSLPTRIDNLDLLPECAKAYRADLEEMGIQSILIVPIFRSPTIVGRLVLMSSRPASWFGFVLGGMKTLGQMIAFHLLYDMTLNDLQLSEEKYRALVEYAIDGIVLIRGGRILYANPALQKMLNFSEQDITSTSPSEYFPEALLQSHDAQLEIQLKRADQSLVDVLCSTAAIEMKGEKSLVVFLKDMTSINRTAMALKESEERYRAVAENANVGIGILMDGAAVYKNQAFADMLGYSLEEMNNLAVHDVLPDSTRGRELAARYEALLQSREVPLRDEIEMVRKDGRIIDVLVSVVRVKIEGRPAFIVLLHDISESKNAERELLRVQAELEERVLQRTQDLNQTNGLLIQEVAERTAAEQHLKRTVSEKEALLRELHHRVKNNLQIILSLLHLQEDYMQEAGARRLIDEISNRVGCMGLVHETLCQSENLAAIDILNYVRTLGNNLLYTYRGHSDDIRLDVQGDALWISIDSAIALGLIVNELVSNSIKHAFAGRDKGHIKIRLRKNEDQRLAIMVSDDGNGLPHGLDVSNTESLGLQLVQALVQQLEGHLEVHNGVGVSFVIELNTPLLEGTETYA